MAQLVLTVAPLAINQATAIADLIYGQICLPTCGPPENLPNGFPV
jgi:hypothetical protein